MLVLGGWRRWNSDGSRAADTGGRRERFISEDEIEGMLIAGTGATRFDALRTSRGRFIALIRRC